MKAILILIITLISYVNSHAQDFKNLDFSEVTNGKLDHWTLEGDGTYDLITVDTLFDTVTLYDGGNTFVKLYTDDTSKIQSAKLVQRAKYEGKYIKDIRIKELFMSNDTTRRRLAGLYIKMYYWDTALNSRRYIYTSGYPFTDSRAPRYPDTIGLFSYNGGLEFPAPDFTDRIDSIEISFYVFDYVYPQFKQQLYFDDLELIYATASAGKPDKLESKLYPNPAENKITLEFTDNEPKEIFITDLTGKVILETVTNNSSLSLDIGGWHSGVYFIKCINADKTSIHKLIKQ
jgi:hypothetical protein